MRKKFGKVIVFMVAAALVVQPIAVSAEEPEVKETQVLPYVAELMGNKEPGGQNALTDSTKVEASAAAEAKSSKPEVTATLAAENGAISMPGSVVPNMTTDKEYAVQITAVFPAASSADKKVKITLPQGMWLNTYPEEKNINGYPNLKPFFENSIRTRLPAPGDSIVGQRAGSLEISLKSTAESVVIPITVKIDNYFLLNQIIDGISVEAFNGTESQKVATDIACADTAEIKMATSDKPEEKAAPGEWSNYVLCGNDFWRNGNRNEYFVEKFTKVFEMPDDVQLKAKNDKVKISEVSAGNGMKKVTLLWENAIKQEVYDDISILIPSTSKYKEGQKVEVKFTGGVFKPSGASEIGYTSGTLYTYTVVKAEEKVNVTTNENSINWVKKSQPDQEAPLFIYSVENEGTKDSASKEIVLKFNHSYYGVTGVRIPYGTTADGEKFNATEVYYRTTKQSSWQQYKGTIDKIVTREMLGITDKDEYITEFKMPVGIMKKGEALTNYLGVSKYTDRIMVYGKVFKNPTDNPDLFNGVGSIDPNTRQTAKIEIKDAEGSQTTGQVELIGYLDQNRNHFIFSPSSDESVTAGQDLKVSYSFVPFFPTSLSAVTRPNIYLRSELGLAFQNFKISNSKGSNLTEECEISSRKTEDGALIYKISMKNVKENDALVGYYKGNEISLNVSFTIKSDKTFAGGEAEFINMAFLEDEEPIERWDSGSGGGDPFDVNANGRIDDGYMLHSTYETAKYTIVPQKTFFTDTAVKEESEPDSAYVNYNNGLKTEIVSAKDKVNLRTDLYNTGASSVNKAAVYIPVPKQGINYGTIFQNKPFGWSMKLDQLLEGTANYEIAYAKAASYPSGNLTEETLAGYDYKTKENWSLSNSEIDIIRIQAKQPIPVNSKESFVFTLSADEGTARAVKVDTEELMNTFNTYYYMDLTGAPSGSSGYVKGDAVALKLSKSYNVEFYYPAGVEADDEVMIGTAEKVLGGAKPTKVPAAKESYSTKDGKFTFKGWKAFNEGNLLEKTEVLNTEILQHTKFYAVYSMEKYRTLTYDASTNGGTLQDGIAEDAQCMWNNPIHLTDKSASRAGYDFKEWNTKADGTGLSVRGGEIFKELSKSQGKDETTGTTVTLYAVFIPKAYTVRFHENGGLSDSIPEPIINQQYDKKVECTQAAAKEGFTFVEWNTKEDGTGYSLLDTWKYSDLVEGDDTITEITLYAIYNEIPAIPDETEKPGKPQKPEVPAQEPAQNAKPLVKKSASKAKTAKTGDAAHTEGAWALLFGAGIASIVLYLRRKSKIRL